MQYKQLKVDVCIIGSEPLFCLQDQRLGGWRSGCDDTFKGNGEPVERDVSCWSAFIIYDHPYDSNPLENSGFTSRIFPWSSTAGLMSYTARRQDTIKYKELSLRCLPGHILGKEVHERVYWRICWIYQPASKPKYRRVWVPHIRIKFSVLQISFRLKCHGVLKYFRIVHYRPK